tara:strand:- start:3776 stop:4036 length:261 start_codon:yes stop_codon:yes gene_type:complete
MTLVNTRAAFEKAVTDAVAAVDATVEMVYDNMVYKTPGKTKKYILMSVDFAQATTQTQGASQIFILVLFNVIFMFQEVRVLLCYLL